MGGGGSKAQSSTVVDTNIVNESVFQALSSSKNYTNSTVLTNQTMELKGIKALSCKMPIRQTATVDVKVLAQFESNDAADLSSMIANNLDQAVQDTSSSESGFGDLLSGGSETNSNTELRTTIENKMKTQITNETINEIRTEIATNQRMKIENLVQDPLGFSVLKELGFPPTIEMMRLASETECPIDQDLAVKFVSEQLGSKVTSIIQETVNETTAQTDLEKETTSKTQGAGEAVADAAEGIGSGVASAAEGVGSGVGSAAEGVGDGIGGAAQGIGAGIGAAMAGPFIPSAIACSSSMAMGMMMMSMGGGGGGGGGGY